MRLAKVQTSLAFLPAFTIFVVDRKTKVDNKEIAMQPKIRINIPTVFFFALSVVLAVLLLAGNKKAEKEKGYDSSSVMNRISYIQELALVKYNSRTITNSSTSTCR